MTEIQLLGVAHFDLHARARVKTALKRENPDAITIEIGEDDIGLLSSMVKNTRGAAALSCEAEPCAQATARRVAAAYGDEFCGAIEYAASSGIPLHCVDDPAFSNYRRNMNLLFTNGELRKTFTPENVRAFLNGYTFATHRQMTEAMYDRITAYHQQPAIQAETSVVQALMLNALKDDRDFFPAERLRELVTSTRGRIVHVCGIGHTLDDLYVRTLYSKLRKMELPVTRTDARQYWPLPPIPAEQLSQNPLHKQIILGIASAGSVCRTERPR